MTAQTPSGENGGMPFVSRFPGLVEVRNNVARWPKKPHRNERYTLREQRELLTYLFTLLDDYAEYPQAIPARDAR